MSAELNEVLIMAFMRGAESMRQQALEFAERLTTDPSLSDDEIVIVQHVLRVFAEQAAAGLANVKKEVTP